MNPPSEDIKDLLVSAGIGTFAASSGWGIYIAEEPESPDTTITLYDTQGEAPDPAWLIDYPRFMVRVRGEEDSYLATYAKALAVRDELNGIAPQTVNSTPYVGIWAMTDVTFVEFDDNRRPVFTVNFRIVREPSQVSDDNRDVLT